MQPEGAVNVVAVQAGPVGVASVPALTFETRFGGFTTVTHGSVWPVAVPATTTRPVIWVFFLPFQLYLLRSFALKTLARAGKVFVGARVTFPRALIVVKVVMFAFLEVRRLLHRHQSRVSRLYYCRVTLLGNHSLAQP